MIFDVRILVRMETTLSSPEDGNALKTDGLHPIAEVGKIPPADMPYPDESFPAVWRGTEAGGEDKRGWGEEIKTRFPHSSLVACTTPPG